LEEIWDESEEREREREREKELREKRVTRSLEQPNRTTSTTAKHFSVVKPLSLHSSELAATKLGLAFATRLPIFE